MMTACKPTYQGNGIAYWSWRMIDGRVCWYEGRPKRDKATLFWEVEGSPKTPAGVLQEPLTAQGPDPDQTTLSAEDRLLLESYWPDLSALPQLFPVDRWWPHDRLAAMLDFSRPFEPPGAERAKVDDLFVGLAGALLAVCGMWLALELWRITGARLRASF